MQAVRAWRNRSIGLRTQPSRCLIQRPFSNARYLLQNGSSVPPSWQVKVRKDDTRPPSRPHFKRPQWQTLFEPYEDHEVIDTTSLSRTLEAHREAHRDVPVIRREYKDANPDTPVIRQMRIKSSSDDAKNSSRVRLFDGARLQLARENPPLTRKTERNEYEGTYRGLAPDWVKLGYLPRKLRLPWWKDGENPSSSESAKQRLSTEIRLVDEFFSPTAEEASVAAQIHKDLEEYTAHYFEPFVRFDLIGSRAAGFAGPFSDLDLNMVVKDADGHERVDISDRRVLAKLYRVLRWPFPKIRKPGPSLFAINSIVSGARVPIIAGTHLPSGLEFQIQTASSGYGSLEVMKGLAAELRSLRALFKVLKQTLKMRGLTMGQGGVTSYPLLNMIAVSLKLYPGHLYPYDLGTNLLRFLDFWCDIDLYKTGITHMPSHYIHQGIQDSFNPSEELYQQFNNEALAQRLIADVTRDPVGARPVLFEVTKSLGEIHRGKNDFMLTLHDPANPYNDLGKSAFWIKHVQATFLDLRRNLRLSMSKWDKRMRDGDQIDEPPNLLGHFIEGDYTNFTVERKRLSGCKDTWSSSDSNMPAD